jgi:hypothetical protein
MNHLQLLNDQSGQILFFKTIKPILNKHFQGHLLYILMSERIGEKEFYKLFPNTIKVSQEEFDNLHDLPEYKQVIPIGDEDIIHDFFNDTYEDTERG